MRIAMETLLLLFCLNGVKGSEPFLFTPSPVRFTPAPAEPYTPAPTLSCPGLIPTLNPTDRFIWLDMSAYTDLSVNKYDAEDYCTFLGQCVGITPNYPAFIDETNDNDLILEINAEMYAECYTNLDILGRLNEECWIGLDLGTDPVTGDVTFEWASGLEVALSFWDGSGNPCASGASCEDSCVAIETDDGENDVASWIVAPCAGQDMYYSIRSTLCMNPLYDSDDVCWHHSSEFTLKCVSKSNPDVLKTGSECDSDHDYAMIVDNSGGSCDDCKPTTWNEVDAHCKKWFGASSRGANWYHSDTTTALQTLCPDPESCWTGSKITQYTSNEDFTMLYSDGSTHSGSYTDWPESPKTWINGHPESSYPYIFMKRGKLRTKYESKLAPVLCEFSGECTYPGSGSSVPVSDNNDHYDPWRNSLPLSWIDIAVIGCLCGIIGIFDMFMCYKCCCKNQTFSYSPVKYIETESECDMYNA